MCDNFSQLVRMLARIPKDDPDLELMIRILAHASADKGCSAEIARILDTQAQAVALRNAIRSKHLGTVEFDLVLRPNRQLSALTPHCPVAVSGAKELRASAYAVVLSEGRRKAPLSQISFDGCIPATPAEARSAIASKSMRVADVRCLIAFAPQYAEKGISNAVCALGTSVFTQGERIPVLRRNREGGVELAFISPADPIPPEASYLGDF